MSRLPLLAALVVLSALAGCSSTPAPQSPPAGPEATDLVLETIMSHALADTFALDTLRELCDVVGPRLAGSEGMRRAHAWAERRLRTAGADSVWLEPVTVPRWERGREWGRLVHPYDAPLNLLALGRSDGTGGVLEAEVIAVRDWDELAARADEVAGKIVLFDPPWRSYGFNVDYRVNGASRAAAHGAVGALIRPAGFGQNTPHTGVMRYDEAQPRIPIASLTVEDAARLHRLSDRGLAPRVQLSLEARNLDDGPCANVVGELRGRELPDEIVLIGGHLDAWDTGDGAHDDGAGCVIMIAALEVLDDLGLRPRRTVRVVLYTSEEYGGQGGRAYAERHADQSYRHVVALESDGGMFAPAGFSVQADSTAVAAMAPYAAPLARLGADEVRRGGSGVDIAPLRDHGTLCLGHRVHNDGYFAYHHGPADVFEAVDPEHLAANVAAVAAFIYGIADSPTALPAPKAD